MSQERQTQWKRRFDRLQCSGSGWLPVVIMIVLTKPTC
jgi:hypothetical protein